MILCRVAGTVVATAKHADFDGLKLLVVQPLDPEQNDRGDAFLAVDRVDAGVGDTVLVMREGNGIRQLFKREKFCVRSAIVGVVDQVAVAPGEGA